MAKYNYDMFTIDASGGDVVKRQIDGEGSYFSIWEADRPVTVIIDDNTSDPITMEQGDYIAVNYSRLYVSVAQGSQIIIAKSKNLILSKAMNISSVGNIGLIESVDDVSPCNTANTAQKTVGDISSIVCNANVDRRSVTITNTGVNNVYWGGSIVSANNGDIIPGGGSITLDKYRGDIHAICDSGKTSILSIVEEAK